MSDDDQSEKPPQKVGYRSPPVDKQFKKGQSGNPPGRPRKLKGVENILKRELEKQITITKDNKKMMITLEEAIYMRLTQKAMSGDYRSIKFVIELRERHPSLPPIDFGEDGIKSLENYVKRKSIKPAEDT